MIRHPPGSAPFPYSTLLRSATGAGDSSSLVDQSGSFAIGSYSGGTNNLDGTIDEAAVYPGDAARPRILPKYKQNTSPDTAYSSYVQADAAMRDLLPRRAVGT